MTLSEIKRILAERGLRLTRSLGQNFMHDGNQLRRMIAAAELAPTDRVLEVGPGLGPLTELLLDRAGEVRAIEKDRRLAEFLARHFAGTTRLTLVQADALEVLQRDFWDWSGWKLVANLPYSVASPILVELARRDACPERMVVTLQREVARRLVAAPGDGDYGLLTLLVQVRYRPGGSFRIPAACFFPRPDVDSACVTLVRRDRPLLAGGKQANFEKIVRRAFSQRRKMVFKLLKADWPEDRLAGAFAALGLSPETRAERIGVESFVQLTRLLTCGNDGS